MRLPNDPRQNCCRRCQQTVSIAQAWGVRWRRCERNPTWNVRHSSQSVLAQGGQLRPGLHCASISLTSNADRTPLAAEGRLCQVRSNASWSVSRAQRQHVERLEGKGIGMQRGQRRERWNTDSEGGFLCPVKVTMLKASTIAVATRGLAT